MRNSNGVTSMTGRTSRRGLGLAVAGGAAVLVLASGGIAMASPLPGHGASTTIGSEVPHLGEWIDRGW